MYNTRGRCAEDSRKHGRWRVDWLPANAQDLVVIPLAGDFQQLLRSLQTLSYFLVVVELSSLLVVLHSCLQNTRRLKTKVCGIPALMVQIKGLKHRVNLVKKGKTATTKHARGNAEGFSAIGDQSVGPFHLSHSPG